MFGKEAVDILLAVVAEREGNADDIFVPLDDSSEEEDEPCEEVLERTAVRARGQLERLASRLLGDLLLCSNLGDDSSASRR